MGYKYHSRFMWHQSGVEENPEHPELAWQYGNVNTHI